MFPLVTTHVENLTEKLPTHLQEPPRSRQAHRRAPGLLPLAEIREAMLDGDVALPVIDELLASIRSKALGSEVMLQLSPDQHVIKTCSR